MRKTTLTIDDELMSEARAALGTTGIKDTIDKALAEAVARHAGQRLIDRLAQMRGLDLDDPAVMEQAWRH